MTITPTVLAGLAVDAAQTSYSFTLSATPASGSTLYASYLARFSTTVTEPTTPTVSGGMSSWTHLSALDAYYDATGTTSKLFVFEGTGTPDAGPVVFDHGTSHHSAGAVIVQMVGDSGTVQIVSGQSETSGTTDDSVTGRTLTFTSTPSGSVFTCASTNSDGVITTGPAEGYSELGTANAAGTYNSTNEVWWDLTGADSTVNWAWAGPNKGAAVAFELEEVTGGGIAVTSSIAVTIGP